MNGLGASAKGRPGSSHGMLPLPEPAQAVSAYGDDPVARRGEAGR